MLRSNLFFFTVVSALIGLTLSCETQETYLPLLPRTCPVRSMENGSVWFFESPQATTLSQCREYESSSCCTQPYAQAIGQNLDLLARDLHSQLSELSAECELDFHKITCSPCAPDSGIFYEHIWNNWFDFYVCRSFCNKMYDSCKSAVLKVSNKTIAQEFPNGEFFCNHMFIDTELFLSVIPDTDRKCFDPLTRDCTAEDIEYHYTDCVNNRTDLLFNWIPGSNCTGGVALPQDKSGLPCPIRCPAGTFLPLGQTTCQQCAAGHYSLGGGHRWDKWDSWPTRNGQFTTYCLDNFGQRINGTNNGYNCTGWKLSDTYIESNIKGQQDTTSVLEVRARLRNNGTVSFVARIDAEIYDKLYFSIDGGESHLIDSAYAETTYTFNISQGFHTLRWRYEKDESIDQGADSAFIYSITITNMADHNDYCESCPAGTTSAPGSSQCQDCPANFYSPDHGSTQCLPCNSSSYSFPGDSECLPRQPCTAADMQVYHGPCTANHDRTEFWSWIEPKICIETNVTLPPAANSVPCADCNAGHYRVGQDCVPCPTGQYSEQGTEFSCQQCPAGHEAPKSLDLDIWDEWPEGTATGCTGICGTTGWRLREDFIDAGSDHGDHVDVSVTFNVEILSHPFGELSFDFELFCQDWCYLEVYDNDRYVDSFWNSGLRSDTVFQREGPYQLPIGKHNITFLFGKWFSRRNNDTARIHKILFEGVKDGGATECIPCPPGSYSAPNAYECDLCQPGYFSRGNATVCEQCPANTYAAFEGVGECRPCGHGTSTPPGSAKCDYGECTYTPSGGLDKYDLNPLARTDKYWGPIYENGMTTAYYFNPCTRTVSNSSFCKDRDGKPLNTSVCQYVAQFGYSLDLGHTVGYYPLQGADFKTKGLIVEYSDGTVGCGSWWMGQSGVPRRTNISFICDPTVGTGRVEPAANIHTDTVYPNVCTFAFEWRSLYACPVCRADHYESIPGPCVDGKQTVTYKWKENPKNCHSGVSLPADTVSNCSTTAVCGPGTYLTGSDDCAGCPAGTYSLGNGEAFDNFAELSPFTSKCVNTSCTPWSPYSGDLLAGTGSSSVEIIRNFKSGQGSSVEFEYKIVGHDSKLTFYIDNDVVFEDDKFSYGYQVHRHDITVGTHRLRWQFDQGARPFPEAHEESMHIRRIDIRGTVSAVSQCTPCDPGEVNDDDRAGCHPCPLNTRAVNGKCEPCPVGTYRLPGPDLSCHPRLPCAPTDFVPVISDIEKHRCDTSGSKVESYQILYEPLLPQICDGNAPAPVNTTACIPCPFGLVLDHGMCRPCGPTSYAHLGRCVSSVEYGFALVPELGFFHTNDVLSGLPLGFSTQCYGADCSTNGWRLNAAGEIESGVHSGEVDNVLTLKQSFINDPTALVTPRVDFNIRLEVHSHKRSEEAVHLDADVELYIDDVYVPIKVTLGQSIFNSVPIRIGDQSTHTIKWVFSQGLTDETAKATLSNIRVFGVRGGGATEQIACPAGHFITTNGACQACAAGTFSMTDKSGKCISCPAGSVSLPGSTFCTTCPVGTMPYQSSKCIPTCIFDIGYHAYNLSSLRNVVETTSTYTLSPCLQLSAPSTCPDCLDAFVFGRDGGNSYSFGNKLEFRDHPYKADDANPKTFSLIFSESDRVPPFCTSVSTQIDFICDLEEGRGHPIVAPGNQDSCHPLFEWRSALACRLCTKDQLVEERSTCQGGTRELLYRPKQNCVLSGNYSMPITESCSAVEVDQKIGGLVALVVILVIIILAVVAFIFWKRKREVETKYERLRGDVPMDEMDANVNLDE